MLSRLPAEILLMIFESVDDTSTFLNLRACNKIFKDYTSAIQNEASLFNTLKLGKSNQHAVKRLEELLSLNLAKYVTEVIVCTSCFYDDDKNREPYVAATARIWNSMRNKTQLQLKGVTWDDCYNDPYDEDHGYTTYEFFPGLGEKYDHMLRFRSLLTYALRRLAESDPKAKAKGTLKYLKLELTAEHSDEEILCCAGKPSYSKPDPNPGSRGRRKFIPLTTREAASYEILAPLMGFHFMLTRVFSTNREKFDGLVEISEIRYSVRHIGIRRDEMGCSFSIEPTDLEIDFSYIFREGKGRDYILEAHEREGQDGYLLICTKESGADRAV